MALVVREETRDAIDKIRRIPSRLLVVLEYAIEHGYIGKSPSEGYVLGGEDSYSVGYDMGRNLKILESL